MMGSRLVWWQDMRSTVLATRAMLTRKQGTMGRYAFKESILEETGRKSFCSQCISNRLMKVRLELKRKYDGVTL